MREITFPKIVGNRTIYMDTMNAILGETPRHSMIDLGCHHAPHTPLLNFEKRRYVDILPNKLDIEEQQQYFEQMDILQLPEDKYYNVSFCLDVIEHLTIPNGIALVNKMENISGKRVFFTPLTDLFGMAEPGNLDPEAHRSLWIPVMLESFFPETFIFITFPNYHEVWNGGAFFFVSLNGDIGAEFERIKKDLKKYKWAK